MGEQHLKNIPNPVHAYMMAPDPRSDDGADHGSPPAAALPPRSRSRPRSRLMLGTAIAVAIAAGLLVTAWQLYPPLQGSSDVTRGLDQAKVRALAANQGIVLPPAFKVLSPGSTVPADVAAYLGAWGGDKRWDADGRQAILIVETVDAAGVALGIMRAGAAAQPEMPSTAIQLGWPSSGPSRTWAWDLRGAPPNTPSSSCRTAPWREHGSPATRAGSILRSRFRGSSRSPSPPALMPPRGAPAPAGPGDSRCRARSSGCGAGSGRPRSSGAACARRCADSGCRGYAASPRFP